MKASIRAYVLEGSADSVTGRLREFPAENLPAGDVTIRVTYSSINFKDAMITAGVGKMIRKFPHIPGVDLAGEVVSDGTGKFKDVSSAASFLKMQTLHFMTRNRTPLKRDLAFLSNLSSQAIK